ncbi:TetR/AcrR family transcriptional regulator [Loigolactobacillus binensis]|uniref:TetR/AcrR family transcriptional regulator n=1 Tax=Loigolactobacillus binensis TaxID=2559922 RepID=A0ABW3EFU4_9LACO|nr:TetR/AcrR family transcriptional regulator [Loigolactobacillus binensis]
MTESKLRELYEQNLRQMDNLTEKQQNILKAALSLFAEQGFDATSSSQIAKRAGVAVGSVYQHFHNKRELLMAVLTPLTKSVFSQAADQFIDKTLDKDYNSLEQFIRALVADRMLFISNNREEFKIMLGQLLSDNQLGPELNHAFNEQPKTTAFPIIDRLKKKKLIIDYPNDVIVQFVFGPLVTFFGKIILAIKPMPIDQEINYAVGLIVNGLTPRSN